MVWPQNFCFQTSWVQLGFGNSKARLREKLLGCIFHNPGILLQYNIKYKI